MPIGSYRLQLTDASGFSEQAPLDRGAGQGLWRRFRPMLAAGGATLWRPFGAQLGDRRFHRPRSVDRAGRRTRCRRRRPQSAACACSTDRPGDCSPYSPNSRLFLNPLYIDVEKLPGFQRAFEGKSTLAAAAASATRRLCRRRRAEMAGAPRRLRRLQGQFRRRAPAGFRAISRRARAAVVAVRLLRGAAAQIQQAMVGMAGGMAAARRGQMRRIARGPGCGRDRIRRIRAMGGRPAVAGLPGSRGAGSA